MKLTPFINPDKLIAIVGGLFLVALIVTSWVPQPCPILRRSLIGCPVTMPLVQTPSDIEAARIPHQDITTTDAVIPVKPDQDRSDTLITFEYRQKDLSHDPVSFLQLQEAGGMVNLALISHPLLSNLLWPALADSHYRLYQRDGNYQTLAEFSASLPPAATLAADSVAVQHFKLKAGSYQPLEDLTSLDGISYVLTSYQPFIKDGQTWRSFRRDVDLTAGTLDSKGQLTLAISFPHHAAGDELLLGTVHVDFYYAERPL